MIWVQRAAAAFFVCSLCFFMFLLFEKSEAQRHTFLPRGEFVQLRPAEFQQQSGTDGLIENRATLRIEEKLPSQLQAISFWIATWGQRVAFSRASLNLGSTECNVELPSGAFEDNSYLSFALQQGCSTERATRAELSIFTQTKSKLALWSKDINGDWLPTSSIKAKIVTADGKYMGYALGNYSRKPSFRETRLKVLLRTWALKDIVVFVSALALALLGILILSARNGVAESKRWVIKITGTFVIVGALWCIVIPPFQAPDEPDHLMSFLDLTKTQDKLGPSMLSFAQRTHFERIKFNETETISQNDLNVPAQAPWAGHISGPDYYERAPLLAFFVKHLSHLGIERVGIESIVILLRMSNLIFILFSMIFCLRFMQAPLLPLVYFLAPPLFFFGMHISNYPISLAVLFPAIAYGVMKLFEGNKSSVSPGLVILPVAGLLSFYLNKTTGQLFPFFTIIMTIGLGTLTGRRLNWFNGFANEKKQIIIFGMLAIGVIVSIILGTKFGPLQSVEQAPYTLIPIKQAAKASFIFISNILGFGHDYSITHTFWNGLGWLDVGTTATIAGINRYCWLALALLAVFLVKGETRLVLASKLIMTLFALAICAGFLSYSLQTRVSVNLSGRYLLPAYIGLFTTIVVSLQSSLKELSDHAVATLKNSLLFLGSSFNLIYLSCALVRYYS